MAPWLKVRFRVSFRRQVQGHQELDIVVEPIVMSTEQSERIGGTGDGGLRLSLRVQGRFKFSVSVSVKGYRVGIGLTARPREGHG